MNKDQIQGAAKDIVGKVQEEAGKLVGNDKQQIKGLNKQITGKVQELVGDVEEIIRSKVRSI
ncbi:MAG TPA: CsbD family protein [Burkholderiaceae bacterium]|nr:CsbD family protein [Burkholderiaceae bacterium]